jgi:hypothetical protein
MSASNTHTSASSVATEKVKKIALSAQSTKYMVFGNWLIDRFVTGGLITTESVNDSRKTIGMWSSVEDQIALYDGFVADLKTNTKEMKITIRQFHKPPKAAKKAKTAASEGEKKRGRKKKEVTQEQDPILALNERLVAAAQSDEPIVEVPLMEYVRAPKAPDTEHDEIKTPEPLTEEELAKPAKPTKPIKKKVNKPVEDTNADVKEEDNKAAKEAAKAEEKLAKAEAKEAAKAEEKEAAKAAKDAAKAAKDAEKEAAKAAKEAEKLAKAEAKELAKAEEKAAKEAEKLAKAEAKAAKPAKPAKEPKKKDNADAVLPIPVLARNSPPAHDQEEEEEEEELECEVFKINDVEYLIDSANTLYDRNTQEIIGTYDPSNKTILKC